MTKKMFVTFFSSSYDVDYDRYLKVLHKVVVIDFVNLFYDFLKYF